MMITTLPILSILIWLPIFMGTILTLVPCNNKQRYYGIITTAITLLFAAYLWQGFDNSVATMQYIEQHSWLPNLGIYYALGVDGFALPLIILTCFINLLVMLSGRVALSAFLIMQGLICGAFAATDAILFYIFFEAMLIPLLLIIGIWGGANRVYAAVKFFLYTLVGSVLLLIALIYLHCMALDAGVALEQSFAISMLEEVGSGAPLVTQSWLFLALLLAFAVKIPMWPLHTWLPDAHSEAPTTGSVILAAITLKMGGYGLLRFVLPIVPGACHAYSTVIIILSLIAIVYIGLVTLVQTDFKRLIAYSSVAHMGFVTLGIFAGFTGDGITAAMLQMQSHGFIAAGLFFCMGVLYDRMHSRNIQDYGGVAHAMPGFAGLFMLFAMANAGLPGTSGFVGEFLVILTVFKQNIYYALLAASTMVLAAAYTLWLYRKLMWGKSASDIIANFKDLCGRERLVLSLLAAAVLIVGLYPKPLIDLTNATANLLATKVMPHV